MKKIILASVLLIGCGRPASKIVHPVIDPVAPQGTPLSERELFQKSWTAIDQKDFIKMDLKYIPSRESYRFNIALCDNVDCDPTYKFFAHGDLKLQDRNYMCLSDIQILIPSSVSDIPVDFFIQDNIPFCIHGEIISGVLTVKLTSPIDKTLTFQSRYLK